MIKCKSKWDSRFAYDLGIIDGFELWRVMVEFTVDRVAPFMLT